VDMYKKILVALDGSEPSNHALVHAATLAQKFGAELTLLAVVQRVMIPIFPDEGYGAVPLSAAKDMAQYQDKMRELYQNVLREAEEKIRKEYPEVKFESILKEGRPSATIVEQAESDDFDIIVMGSRGIGGYTGWILGSTSRRVVDSCTKPILVVK
jgi:nucleotide-binding universal stress UspA family protein